MALRHWKHKKVETQEIGNKTVFGNEKTMVIGKELDYENANKNSCSR